MRRLIYGLVLLCVFAMSSFAQTGNAQLGGIVGDPTKALIPGVTVTAKNMDTGVATTQLTNDSGTYNFPVLQPGNYEVTAELTGFKKVIEKVQLPYAGQVRVNFTLEVGQVAQSVEVTANSDTLLRESSASVGNVLTREQVESLPLVGNNVLDLLGTLPGLRSSEFGTAFDTVNGLGTNSINATRDGMSINDVRNPAQIYGTRTLSSTLLLPDLVGEIRMILSPVDAELGHGNSQIQISTRSGTNKYTGAVSWNVRNSGLDANTWTNNHTPFTDPFSGDRLTYTPKNWTNNNQYTVSYGGPVRIPGLYDGRNKTFFFGLWEQNISNSRDLVSTPVLTDTAREGIYRYWSGYNPLGWNPAGTLAAPTYPQPAASATLIAVDVNGNPVRPVADPLSPTGNPGVAGFIPYSGNLICFSVFGTTRLDANGNMVPFTQADCPGGNAVLPTGRAAWDNFRPAADSSGLIAKFLQATPKATYFGAGDGLNVAQIRWVRGKNLSSSLFDANNSNNAVVGTINATNNKQINLKIDHNFNARNKVAVSWTYQREDTADNGPGYPNGIFGSVLRRPHTLTVNGTSTLSPRMVNEARFGTTYDLNQDVQPWESQNSAIRDQARSFLLPAGNSVLNPSYQYLALVSSASGNVSTSNGFMSTTAAGNYQKSLLYNWADTLSWSLGKHAFKFGFDWRLPRSAGTGASQAYPTVTLGNASGATTSPFSTPANFNLSTDTVGFLPGLLNTAATGATAARTNVVSLLQYLSGSVASVSQNYWITSSNNISQGYWDDISTNGLRIRNQISQEWAAFAKDDYKLTRRLTLNLGVRWEYYSSPYIQGGFTTAFRDGGYGAFGATRAARTSVADFDSDPFKFFLSPGNLYLSGYGSTSSNPLSCQNGVQQNALLPVSTCDPSALSVVDFVGPGTPNPNRTAIPQNYNNIGPAIGFAYTLPWFGEGKTTIRGGYQQTYGNASQNRSALNGGTEATLANAPGVVTSGTLTGHINDANLQSILANRAITLGDIATLVPSAPIPVTPGQPLNIYAATAGPGAGVNWNVYDPNLKTPYTQNLTLSVTRQISSKYTLQATYTGTLGRKQLGSIDINQNNVYTNPELFQALTDARAGTCTPNSAAYKANYTDKGINPCDSIGDPVILDQLLAGLNLNVGVSGATGTGSYDFVGKNNTANIYQSGAEQLRRSGAFPPGQFSSVQQLLSWGDFNSVANYLLTLAPTTQQGRQNLPIDPNTGVAITGVGQTGMRNGCDRMGNGAAYVQQSITMTNGVPVVAFNPGFNASNSTPLRCFPEDWMHANPQFGFTGTSSVIYNTNTARSSYNSLQMQLTARPIQGITTSTTLTWAKSFNVPGSGYIDPLNRNLNYGVQAIAPLNLRMNGTVELPIGPNKFLFGNASGWVARAIERWQTGFIFSGSNGTPATFNPGQNHFYAVSGYDVVSPNWVIPQPRVQWNNGTTTGTMYPDYKYSAVTDPSCFDPSIVTMGDKMGTVLGRIPANGSTPASGPCTIFALAATNPDGTPGEVLLQYPQPGKVGSLGHGNLRYFGSWSLDMNASKTFRVSESKSFQLRVDATNVMNHAVPAFPTLGASNLGGITGKGNQVRSLQAQLRVSF